MLNKSQLTSIKYVVLKDTAEILQVRISILPKKIYLDTPEIVVEFIQLLMKELG